jgi:hypothetical protein
MGPARYRWRSMPCQMSTLTAGFQPRKQAGPQCGPLSKCQKIVLSQMKKRIYKKKPRKPDSRWGVLGEAIMQAITDLGPMTRAELCDYLKHDAESVSSVLARLRRPTKERPQRLYISGWVSDHEGMRAYPRAQYSLGAEPDKKRRWVSQSQRHSARQTETLKRMKTSSVFHLGMTRDQLRAQARGAV